MTSRLLISVRRGAARSRARRLGQSGVSLESREAAWDRLLALLRCGHRVSEVRAGHDAKVCREELDRQLAGELAHGEDADG